MVKVINENDIIDILKNCYGADKVILYRFEKYQNRAHVTKSCKIVAHVTINTKKEI